MPTKIYYLDAARTDAVTASWNLFFRNFRLDYQGQELGQLSAAELKAGHEFTLPDGRRLLVRLQQQFGAQGLDFQLEGQPLSGTVNDPRTQLNHGIWGAAAHCWLQRGLVGGTAGPRSGAGAIGPRLGDTGGGPALRRAGRAG
jgi:hypothetical protein